MQKAIPRSEPRRRAMSAVSRTGLLIRTWESTEDRCLLTLKDYGRNPVSGSFKQLSAITIVATNLARLRAENPPAMSVEFFE